MRTTPPQKVALITGGSRGLGRAMAERFANDGLLVVLTYRQDAAAAANVVESITASGGHAHAVRADVSSVQGVDAMYNAVDHTLSTLGLPPALDVLVPNAGVFSTSSVAQITEAEFDQLFDVNVKGTFFTIQRGLSRLRDGGRILTIGSGLTRFVMPEAMVYSASKGAIDTLTKALAQQLGERGITVNTLAPGPIDTEMNPWLHTPEGAAAMSAITALHRVGHANDIADIASFLISPDARWITAQRIEASGGMRL